MIFSYQGTRLIGAERELSSIWESMTQDQVYCLSSENGTEWNFGPPDSPWHQSAAKALVKSVKRAIRFSINDHGVSLTELSALFYDVDNLLNE